MKLQNLRFRTRLIIGYGSGLLMTALIIIIAIIEIQNISKHTNLIYHHPFIVSNTVKDINIYINAMHSSMQDVVLAENQEQVKNAVNIVSEYDNKVHEAFDIVYDRFLGDKKIIDEAHNAFIEWKSMRIEIIDLMQKGKKEEAANITKGKCAKHVQFLFAKTKKLIDFAENKANKFHTNIKYLEKRSIIILIIVSFFLFLIIIIISLTISKSISRPIANFIEKTKYLYQKDSNVNLGINKLSEQNILNDVSIQLINSYKKLNFEINARKKAQLKLIESEQKFRNLFFENPVSLWEEDFSGIMKLLDAKKKEGITDFIKYFDDNPEFVLECVSKIKVLYINQASLDIFKTPSKEYLINNISKTFNKKTIETFKRELANVAEGKNMFREETEFLNFKGEVFAAIIQLSFFEKSNKLLVSITDISQLKETEKALQKSENTLRTIVLETSNKSDHDYFDVLTKILSKTLGADYVLVGVLTDGDTRKIRTISVCDKNNILDNFEYELDGSPCKNVADKTIGVYKKNVAEIFPEDDLLKQMKIEGYIGVPLFSTNKVAIGILVCLYQNPIKNANFDETILQIFANRTGTELERLNIIDSLSQKNIELTSSEEKLKLTNIELTKLSEVLNEKNIKLTKSEQQLKEAQSIAKMGHWHLDLVKNKLIWSDEIYRIFDLKPRKFEANYETFLNAIHPDDREMVDKSYRDSVKNKTNYNIQHRLLLKNNEFKFLNVECRTEYDDTGNPLFSIGTIQDITQQKKIENEMKKLNTAVEQSANIVLITNKQGKIEYVNKKFTELTGYSKKEAIGKTPNILKSGKQSKEFYENLWATIKSGKKWSGEILNKKKNGELYWESTTITPIFSDNGYLTNLIAIKEDITERKLMEQKISNVAINAEEKERGRLAKDLHDGLGPLLSAAKLYIESLKYNDSKKLNEETLVKFNKIIDEAIISTKEIANNLSPHLLKNFGLTAAIKTFSNKLFSDENMDINIRSNLDMRISENIEITIYRIVIELMNNSLKYAEASIIDIDINKDNNNLFINYADNGIGFDVKKALEMPTGLGFNNIINRVNIINGELEIDSKPNKGSVFKIKIPLKL